MTNFLKTNKEVFLDYGFLGGKLLVAFTSVVSQTLLLAYLYFVVDLFHSFVQKYRDKKHEDLSDGKRDSIAEVTQQTKDDLDKMAREQKKYYAEESKRNKSLSLLNKLLIESEVRERDLLSLTSTSEYYHLFVYSASLGRLVKSLEIPDFTSQPNRQYPVFLRSLGFARLGKASGCFLINKKNLKNNKLVDIKEFKKFLMYHFSKIRSNEWDEFVAFVDEKDGGKAAILREKGYEDEGYLKINFLLTETNINITNMGLIDGEYIGLADVKNREDINRQIFIGKDIKLDSDKEVLKVRVMKVLNKQDISLLLFGVTLDNKIRIETEQDSIKANLKIKTVLDFSCVNPKDLQNEFTRIGLSEEDSRVVAKDIISRAQEYQTALENLKINIYS